MLRGGWSWARCSRRTRDYQLNGLGSAVGYREPSLWTGEGVPIKCHVRGPCARHCQRKAGGVFFLDECRNHSAFRREGHNWLLAVGLPEGHPDAGLASQNLSLAHAVSGEVGRNIHAQIRGAGITREAALKGCNLLVQSLNTK